ncbi:MAG: carbohydrate-binding family 9-like protein [Pyrinomonadaceae bacterium]
MRLVCVACALALAASSSSATGRVVRSQKRGARQEKMKADDDNLIEVRRAAHDFAVTDFDNMEWRRARAVKIGRYWSGEVAPRERRAEARLLWTDAALYVRFDAPQGEPRVASEKPRTDAKTLGLWDRDVCELFVAPNADEPERYYEFEVAPTGEWLDARIHQMPDKRESDFEYHSGATFAARSSEHSSVLAMRVPWSALGGAPRAGARWRANLYRCVGKDPARGYVAWQPTLTPQPNFHVPTKFGWLRFK